jgi:uncharacterized membrane protein YhhN
MPVVISVFYLILALAGTSLHLVHFGWMEPVMKTMPAVFLALCAWAYTRPRFGLWVTVGVAMGAMGDYCLSSAERSWFLAGVATFLIGHVAYSVAFGKDLHRTRTREVIIVGTAIFMAMLVTAVSVRMAHVGEYGLIAPLCVYVAVMGVMMAIAVLHQSPTKFIAAGGVIFVISDAHIAVNHMLLEQSWFVLGISGYATYYLAQYLLVAGAAYESRQSG